MSQAATADEGPRLKERGVAERVTEAPPRTRGLNRRIVRPLLMLGGILAVAAGSGFYWLQGGRYVSVDDAYVRAAKQALATDVSGIVQTVAVHEGQHVGKGDVLLTLDPRPFEIAVAGATAALNGMVSTLNAMKLEYRRLQREVEVKAAQVDADQANNERMSGLVKSGGVTRAEYDNTRFQLAANRQALEALKVAAAVQLARLGGDPEVMSAPWRTTCKPRRGWMRRSGSWSTP